MIPISPILLHALPAGVLASGTPLMRANDNLELVLGILLFGGVAGAAGFGGLLLGWILRPKKPSPEKAEVYECGEPTIGPCDVQFDLRFYTVALVFIVFDVEIALLWPWAVVFKDMGAPAFWAFFVFFLLIAIPFAYEVASGYLSWVRASSSERPASVLSPSEPPASPGADASAA